VVVGRALYYRANVLHLIRAEQNLFDTFASSVRALPDLPGSQRFTKADLLTPEFCLYQDGPLTVYYAPLDYVNQAARIVIVGITPGWTQMEIAFRGARQDLLKGLSSDEVCRRAKQQASFAGSMRKNLTSMLDAIELPAYLDIDSTQSLFAEHGQLLHATQAIRYPVFVEGRNYTGHTPNLLKTASLRYFIENVLTDELRSAHEAVIVPLGRSVAEVLDFLADGGHLDRDRCLFGFPHPSGANGHRVREFRERRGNLRRKVKQWIG
jgi:uracil DNA glycosylase superfamily protein